MGAPFRLATGGRIDRSRTISFTFDGARYTGHPGDTLASALLAHGVVLMGRSFKYHRPRGVISAGSEEPNALVGVTRDRARFSPNFRATQIELYEGLVAESQNRWPNLGFDIGVVNNLFSRFIPAGFYYKTFMWPRSAWDKLYEPVIRKAAGLGEAPTLPDPDTYQNRYAHCEVLIVGAGPAGIAAALTAAEGGERVFLIDEQAEPGGSLLAEREATIDGKSAAEWLESSIAKLKSFANVTLLTRTNAFAYNAHNMICANERLTDPGSRRDSGARLGRTPAGLPGQ